MTTVLSRTARARLLVEKLLRFLGRRRVRVLLNDFAQALADLFVEAAACVKKQCSVQQLAGWLVLGFDCLAMPALFCVAPILFGFLLLFGLALPFSSCPAAVHRRRPLSGKSERFP